MFVGGLSWQTDDVKLRSYFENFGSVIEAVSALTMQNYSIMLQAYL